MLEAEPHWIDKLKEQKDVYSGRVLSANLLSFKIPAFKYSLLHRRGLIEGELPKNVMDSIDKTAHQIHDDNLHRRRTKEVTFEFPSDHELSARVINQDAGESDELPTSIEFIEFIRFDEDEHGDTNEETWACWMVARVDKDSDPSKRGKIDEDAKLSKAEKVLLAAREKKAKKRVREWCLDEQCVLIYY
jgi:hypothetical protein